MLITKLSEIRSILPTMKWDDISSLSSLLQEEEDNTLSVILGDELLDKLIEDYESTLSSNQQLTSSQQLAAKVITVCQKIELYLMLANNSGLLSVSFNKGGGLNSMVADDYNTPNNDQIKRFERDAWNKAHRCIDTLLRILEKDAQSASPVYLNYWRSSKYFYRKANLLFTTALELQDYLDINSSREKFIQLLPDIKYTQDTYIAPRIGTDVLSLILSKKYTAEPAGSGSGSGSGTADTEQSDVNQNLLDILAEKIRMSAALYIEHSHKDMRREDSLNHAEMQIALAVKLLDDNQLYFRTIAPTSPAYTTQSTVPETSSSSQPAHQSTEGYDIKDNSNAVFAPFLSSGLNRY